MSKDIKVEPSEVSTGDDGAREARFLWYYMTTTVTSLSTSTSTSTTYTATISISLQTCTPPGAFVACG